MVILIFQVVLDALAILVGTSSTVSLDLPVVVAVSMARVAPVSLVAVAGMVIPVVVVFQVAL